MSSPNASFNLSHVQAIDLAKPSHSINTGIGFFDHMLDQLNSHAQVGISVHVAKNTSNPGEDKASDNANDNVNTSMEDRNRFANPPELQEELMSLVGEALGSEINKLIPSTAGKSRFCCPLDEALVECTLSLSNENDDGSGSLAAFALAPYGIYPSNVGRTKIGQMMTAPLESFFTCLAKTSGLNISLVKRRGDNGHHVVESSFKAFSRALRNLIDGTNVDVDIDTDIDTATDDTSNMASMWGIQSQSYKESIDLNRSAKSSRATRETSIDVELKLDGGSSTAGISVNTGVQSLNDFYTRLANDAQVSLNVKCNGDTWVDDHHTTEDVSIAIGKVLNISLGTKAGLNRMWCAVAKVGEAVVEVTMDLSNRPCITHDLSLSTSGEEYVGDMSIEMFDHVLDSLVMNAQMTLHIVEKSKGDNVMDLVIATAAAFGKSLRLCAAVDPRRAGKTASSKGTLSV